ncbi:MAG: TldD/PmbA family protein [Acidobacteria bacterium]|nr:TldD/PmbA family protein [Acidobacteriota bacterium]
MEGRRAFASIALDVAKRRGAAFADVRIVRRINQMLVAKNDQVIGVGERVYGAWPNRVGEKQDVGFNVRVLKNGAWGFAASPVFMEDECRAVADMACDLAELSARTMPARITLVAEPAYVDTYVTPHEEDPFAVPLDEKLSLLLRINERLRSEARIDRAYSWLDFWDDRKYYANSDGSSIDQRIVRSDGSYMARALVNGVRAQRRFFLNPLNIGYEYIRRSRLLDEADRIAAEAVEKATAARLSGEKRTTVIMDPQNICLLEHESIGHPTELNRTLLVETNFAGSTFLSPADLGRYRYGPKIMNVVADRSRPTLRATCGYDDEGVKTQQWDIIREGVLVGFQTTRDFAGYLNEPRSRGCCLTESWDRVPQARIPNLGLEGGGDDAPSPDQLIADTKDGLLFSGFAIFIVQDHQRRNHTYTADAVWEIKNGKKGRMLRDVYYQGDNPREIWQAMDAVTNRASWEPAALDSDDIGQPTQRNHNSHGAPWARFRNMKVGGPTI